MTHKIELLSTEDRAYIAGFLDGDGSVFLQLVQRADYKLKFQIKTTVNFTQKSSRVWFLEYLLKKVGCGIVRDRKDGCWEYAISQNNEVKSLLEALAPHLVVKNKQARLALRVIGSLSKNQSIESFLNSVELVEQVAALNDSTNRTITIETVREVLIKPSP